MDAFVSGHLGVRTPEYRRQAESYLEITWATCDGMGPHGKFWIGRDAAIPFGALDFALLTVETCHRIAGMSSATDQGAILVTGACGHIGFSDHNTVDGIAACGDR